MEPSLSHTEAPTMGQAFPTSKRHRFSYREKNAAVLHIERNVIIIKGKSRISGQTKVTLERMDLKITVLHVEAERRVPNT